MKKQGISTFISGLGRILGIFGIIGSIIIGVLLDNDFSAIIIVAGILISLVDLGVLLGLSQIITNTYNTYLNTLNTNKTEKKNNNTPANTTVDELPEL